MPLLEIKDFNALIENKPFFDQPVKKKQEAYEKLTEMLKYDDYTTRLFVLSKLLASLRNNNWSGNRNVKTDSVVMCMRFSMETPKPRC